MVIGNSFAIPTWNSFAIEFSFPVLRRNPFLTLISVWSQWHSDHTEHTVKTRVRLDRTAEESGNFGGSGSDPRPLKMSVIPYFLTEFTMLINLGQVSSCYVMSWASPAEEWGDFGVSGSDPPPLKMSVIAYFWQSWPCWLIWNRFQVVT